MFTLSLVCACAELEDVRYVIDGVSYPEYEVKSLQNGESIKQGDEVLCRDSNGGWYNGVVTEIKSRSSSVTTSEVVRDIIIQDTAERDAAMLMNSPAAPNLRKPLCRTGGGTHSSTLSR